MSVNTDLADTIYGHRARIGYTSPPFTTEVFPYEFYQIVPAGVTLVITTLAIITRTPEEIAASYETSLKAAREMAAAGVDIVIFGGVPINLSKGAENAGRMLAEMERELGIKISSSAAAQRAAVTALGSNKAVVAHPYAHADTQRLGSYAQEFGCELLGATGWGSAFNQIGRIPKSAALTMARQLMRDHPDADTVLLPSPHWPTADAIDTIEREFGVNVVAAHQAIVWHALRRCGIDDSITGFGRLLREF